MPPFESVALEHASRLLNHGPTVLVTSAADGRRHVMAAAWSMPVEFTPPRIAIVIDKQTHTRELIHASGAFGVCIPGAALVDLTFAVGSESGRTVDKFAKYGIASTTSPTLGVPLMQAGCVAWLECRLLPEPHNQQTYDLFLGEVVAAYADERVFSDGRWHFEGHDELRTLHHVAGGHFLTIGQPITGKSLA